MELNQLISAIQATHNFSQGFAVQQVNSALTIRNWIIGFYIFEYEQHGEDRAVYGEHAMKELAKRLKHIKGISEPQLYRFRDFYKTYPQMWGVVISKFQSVDYQFNEILSTVSRKLETIEILPTPEHSIIPEILFSRLSFSHFVELLRLDTPLKRAFYEVQAIKNNWGVRDLERAVS